MLKTIIQLDELAHHHAKIHGPPLDLRHVIDHAYHERRIEAQEWLHLNKYLKSLPDWPREEVRPRGLTSQSSAPLPPSPEARASTGYPEAENLG